MRSPRTGRWSILAAFTLVLLAVNCGDDDPTSPSDDGASTPLAFDNFQEASVVIGQVDMTSAVFASGRGALLTPSGTSSGSLYVVDTGHNRIMGFEGVPTTNGQNADFVIGQLDFRSGTAGLGPGQLTFPTDCWAGSGRLLVADYGNNRVLIWNSLPQAHWPADVVVGQPDLYSNAQGTTQSALRAPERLTVAGGKLFVVDAGNRRVLIWNTVPESNGAPADVVVGQPDFTSSGAGLTATTFGIPQGLWSDGTRLVVGDGGINRVLIWNSIPTTNGAPADVVIGAPDFTTAGSSAASATSVAEPYGIASDGSSLFVADTDLNRVLIFSPFPTTNGAAAVGVLGQSDFSGSFANAGGSTAANTLSGPMAVSVHGNNLLVSDLFNNRVVVFRSK